MSKTLQEKTTFLCSTPGKLLEAAGYGGMLIVAVCWRYLRRNRRQIFRLHAKSSRLSTLAAPSFFATVPHLFFGFRLWCGKYLCLAALKDVYEDNASVTERGISNRQ